MAVSYRAFLIELYEEYLNTGGFLEQQRKNLLANPFGKWGLIADWEERHEACLDGLSVGGSLALEVCYRRAVEGEPGEFQCALRLFFRAARPDLIEAAIVEAGAVEGPKAAAIGDALVHERGAAMIQVIRRLAQLNPGLIPVLARVAGHQRLPVSDLLLRSNRTDASIVWALGRLRDPVAAEPLRRILRTAGGKEKQTAALALLRIQNSLSASESWPPVAFGLMGRADLLPELIVDSEPGSSLALGLLGIPSTVPALIARLPQPEACIALQLITGAGLMANPEPESDDAAESPGPAVACDAKVWTEWWNRNQSKFARIDCARGGQTYSRESLERLLCDPDRMHVERYWAAEQLAARHASALLFEPDMLVRHQPAALNLMR